jgi:hypothetical protein
VPYISYVQCQRVCIINDVWSTTTTTEAAATKTTKTIATSFYQLLPLKKRSKEVFTLKLVTVDDAAPPSPVFYY